jgi:hypothetical protein
MIQSDAHLRINASPDASARAAAPAVFVPEGNAGLCSVNGDKAVLKSTYDDAVISYVTQL